MMLEHNDVSLDVFGLAGTFPRPGWVVLDAARQHGFTGELTFETIPSVKVYLDGGLIYLAERVTDPSLGSRLIDAGALNAAQLEHGSMMVGDVAHLGRLFERVPSVNRHTVMVMTEMMTEECVGWLAGQLVRDVETAPYRHHPAGVQRWLHPTPTTNLAPGAPLPSPPADEAPAELVAPEPLFSPGGLFDDGLITWDQPSWLDDRPPSPPPIDLLFDDIDNDSGVGTESSRSAPVAEVASEPETIEAPTSPAPPLTDSDYPPEAETERFEPFATPAPQAVPAPSAFAAPDPGQLAFRVPTARTDSPRLPEPPVVDPPALRVEPAADDVEGIVADRTNSAHLVEPAPRPVVPDDWADLVASVAESDPPDTESPGHTIEPPEVWDGGSPAPVALTGDWADLVAAVTEPEPELEPLPVRKRAHSQPSLGAPDQPPDHSAAVEPTLAPHNEAPDRAPRSAMDDWVDHLDADGLPEPGSELLMTTKRLPPAPVVAADRFELIWPSGEIDEQFGSSDSASIADRHPDLDRAGPTARLATTSGAARAAGAATVEHDQNQTESAHDQPVNGHDEITDEVVLAVRRAVASIETGSLDARRRLVTADPANDPSRGIADRSIRSLRPVSETSDALTPGANSARRVPTRSVFDDDVTATMPEPVLPPVPAAPVVEPQVERVGALRRLIGSLRRR